MRNSKTAQTISYFVAFVALGLAMAALGPTLRGLANQTNVDIGTISYLFTMRSFGFLLGSLFSGRYYDRLRGHVVMAVMIFAMSATMAVMPVVSSFPVLLGVMLMLGTAEGALGVGGNALLVWVHQSRVAPYMNALHFFYGVGGMLSPLVIKQVVSMQDPTTPNSTLMTYLALALLILPAAALLLSLPSPSPPQASAAAVSTEPTNYKLIILVALLLCMYIGAEVSYGGWIFNYVVAMKLGDEGMGNSLTSLFWGALTAGRLICIPIAVRLRPRLILLGDLIGCFLSIGIALLWPTSLTAISIATVCIGLSMGSIYPTALTFAERRMSISGQAMSFFIVGGSAGGMIVPLLVGQLFESIGPRVMMITVLIDLVIALMIYFMLVLGTSPRRQAVADRQQQAVSD